MNQTPLESVLSQAQQLSPLDKVRLVEQVMASLEQDLQEAQPKRSRRSLLGVLAEYAPAPSTEEIDQARREMWGNFPREDI